MRQCLRLRLRLRLSLGMRNGPPTFFVFDARHERGGVIDKECSFLLGELSAGTTAVAWRPECTSRPVTFFKAGRPQHQQLGTITHDMNGLPDAVTTPRLSAEHVVLRKHFNDGQKLS
ncbi:hypothetical protein D9M70_606600 [compost metagenome]